MLLIRFRDETGEMSMDLIRVFKEAEDLRHFSAGSILFEEGQYGDEMYVLVDGEIELRVHGKVVDTIGAGEILGEMALIDSHRRSATALAKTDCNVVAIDEKRFLWMVQETPFFSLHVMRVLADRLRRMDEAF